MRPNSTVILLGLVAMQLAAPHGAVAETTRPAQQWSRVDSLRPGRALTIQPHKGRGEKISGVFLRADGDGVIIVSRRGTEQRIARGDIRRVKARRETNYGMWTGATIGATAMGVGVSRRLANSDDDPGLKGHALVLGVGAAFGALAGMLFDRGSVLIYEAPPPKVGTGTRAGPSPRSATGTIQNSKRKNAPDSFAPARSAYRVRPQ